MAEDLAEVNVQYLGVWDSVGGLGIPNHLRWLAKLFNRKYSFHDTTLSSFVLRARHAVAVDERRRTFEPSLWSNLDDLNEAAPRRYEQLLFPGTHAAVGGGGPIRGLSDAALEWIFRGAREQGLAFDTDEQSPIFTLQPNHRAALFNATGKTKWSFGDKAIGVGLRDRSFAGIDRRALHDTLARRYRTPAEELPEKEPYRPPALRDYWEVLAELANEDAQDIAVAQQAASDARALRSPSRVKKYVIKPGDTLASIAKSEMTEGPADELILKLHNRTVGLMFETEEVYAGSELEIPIYDVVKAPQPEKKDQFEEPPGDAAVAEGEAVAGPETRS